MSAPRIHNFGLVDENGDAFEFSIDAAGNGCCQLVAVLQTERGPRRTEVAAISADQWNVVAEAAVKELVAEMGETERERKAPTLRAGINRISPLVGREIGVLLIVLMEDGASERTVALLHAWRELAREERWWLYAKATAPGQRVGAGWRKALFHGLSETSETRVAPPAESQIKSLWEHRDSLCTEGTKEYSTSECKDSEHSLKQQPVATQAHVLRSDKRRSKRKSSETAEAGQMRFF